MPGTQRLTFEDVKSKTGRMRMILRLFQSVLEMTPKGPPEVDKITTEQMALAISDTKALASELLRVYAINDRNKALHERVRAELIETRSERDGVLIELAHERGEEMPEHLRTKKVVDGILEDVLSKKGNGGTR